MMKTLLLSGAVLAVLLLTVIEGRSLIPRGRWHEGQRGKLGEEVCNLEPETGRCYARMLMWFYNATSETCERFTYGGCQGNANRFWSKHACNRACSDPCGKPLEVGHQCSDERKEPLNHFYFDAELNQCKPFMYLGCGGNSNRFWTLQHCERKCVEESTEELETLESDESTENDDVPAIPEKCRGRPVCRIFCRYGFQNGDDGCPICRCNRRPESDENSSPRRCRPVTCLMHCPYGFQRGTDGCPTCRCNGPALESREDSLPEHCQGRPMCPRICRYGFQKDAEGCSVCRCNPPPRKDDMPEHCRGKPMCRLHCRNGFQTGEDGCPICSCKLDIMDPTLPAIPRHCRNRPACKMFCVNGFQRGDDGCPICSCNPPLVAETEVEIRPEPVRAVAGVSNPSSCPRIMCRMYCRNGFEEDANGCPICKCVRDAIESDDDLEEEIAGKDVCSLAPEVGRCRGRMPRFYFDPETGECEQFFYGGCGGNGNNFRSLESCRQRCGGD